MGEVREQMLGAVPVVAASSECWLGAPMPVVGCPGPVDDTRWSLQPGGYCVGVFASTVRLETVGPVLQVALDPWA